MLRSIIVLALILQVLVGCTSTPKEFFPTLEEAIAYELATGKDNIEVLITNENYDAVFFRNEDTLVLGKYEKKQKGYKYSNTGSYGVGVAENMTAQMSSVFRLDSHYGEPKGSTQVTFGYIKNPKNINLVEIQYDNGQTDRIKLMNNAFLTFVQSEKKLNAGRRFTAFDKSGNILKEFPKDFRIKESASP